MDYIDGDDSEPKEDTRAVRLLRLLQDEDTAGVYLPFDEWRMRYDETTGETSRSRCVCIGRLQHTRRP